ncbi:MAG: type II secretion system protein [Gemmatimonadetes bacterium]|uniref:Type II secretion system protein n=1 Tax=Candidatus Kutchimonas denitrificans TaxID=3056748 RepID=A0AAE5C8D9_9BACT|nr:type II secretion system protein [Gemmatimonadota bacterium]NIR74401.1 type II secretion system protein [Candidatus Kutchimonas denitrificans]NIS02652.1 type II secretion system protein [Gemmatimonadota bacterium]NIT68527.1 type II secretion system protein [Gemmatimonadota bacterium]NIU52004.1 prepilin-type N-terminal cleavage/methylation domain-containing protein [Gemmatimonadota bacterium]
MSRRGFTLIELLTAMVLLAVLAAISLKIVDARAQAYLAVLESDLKNLAVAQEAYYVESADRLGGARYAPNMEHIEFNPSPFVQMTMVGIETGWTARAQHKLRTDFRCAVYMGDIKAIIKPYEPAITEGVIECEPKRRGKGKGK